MSLRILVKSSGLALLLGGLLMSAAPAAADSRGSLEELRARMDARRLALQELLAERRGATSEEETDAVETGEEEKVCECRGRISLTRPQLTWRNGSLAFLPRVDIDLRINGEADDPDWAVGLMYEGVVVAEGVAPVNFAGQQNVVGGQCGTHHYALNGVALEPVTVAEVVRSALGLASEVSGQVTMKAELTGCEAETGHKYFGFDVEGLGNLGTGFWRRAR